MRTKTHSIRWSINNIVGRKAQPARCPRVELEPRTPRSTPRTNTTTRFISATLSVGTCGALWLKMPYGARESRGKVQNFRASIFSSKSSEVADGFPLAYHCCRAAVLSWEGFQGHIWAQQEHCDPSASLSDGFRGWVQVMTAYKAPHCWLGRISQPSRCVVLWFLKFSLSFLDFQWFFSLKENLSEQNFFVVTDMKTDMPIITSKK